MKALIFTALLASGLAVIMPTKTFAQQDSLSKAQQDSVMKLKKKRISINKDGGQIIAIGTNTKDTTAKTGRFVGGITFTRVDLGFSRMIDNGSFTLSPENQFLGYRGGKTSTFSFDVVQFGYRFNSNFKVYLAGGFDWTLIRLKNNITIDKNSPTLSYTNGSISFSKNRFSNSYVHIPLNFELRTKENEKGKRFYIIAGPEVSFLLSGKVKQISAEKGKEKFYDDYHFQSLRYGATFRIGYSGIGLFAKYYFNDMFDTPAQKGIKNMSFGLTFGLN